MASLVRKFRRKAGKSTSETKENKESTGFNCLCFTTSDNIDESKRPVERERVELDRDTQENMGKVESKEYKKGSAELIEVGKQVPDKLKKTKVKPKDTCNDSKPERKESVNVNTVTNEHKSETINGADERDIVVDIHEQNGMQSNVEPTNADKVVNEYENSRYSSSSDSDNSYKSCSEKKSNIKHKSESIENEETLSKDDATKTEHIENKSPDAGASNNSEKNDVDTGKNAQRMKENSKKKHPFGRMQSKLMDILSYQNVDSFSPEVCIDIMKSPSLKFLSALNRKLKQNNKEWNGEFLDLHGSEALLDLVDTLGIKRVTQLSDAMLLLECIVCIKTLMNSKMGLRYLVEHIGSLNRIVIGK